MDRIDQVQQWHELRETYGQMAEGELCRVADNAFDLTPIALEALQSIIHERGLKIQLTVTPPKPEPSVQAAEEDGIDPEHKLIRVRKLKSEAEAQQAKAILDDNFIASCVGPDNIVNLEDFQGSFSGGIDLKVFSRDSRRARAALDMFAPEKDEELEQYDEEAEYVLLCPKCDSPEIVLGALVPKTEDDKKIENKESETADSEKYDWTCDACGYTWKDEGIQQKL